MSSEVGVTCIGSSVKMRLATKDVATGKQGSSWQYVLGCGKDTASGHADQCRMGGYARGGGVAEAS